MTKIVNNDDLIETLEPLEQIRLVDFDTWSRLVNGSWRTSIIDHIYTNEETITSNLKPTELLTGDHKMLTFPIEGKVVDPVKSFLRDWHQYTKEKLLNEMVKYHWDT